MKNILICFLIIFSLLLGACDSKLNLQKVKQINSQIATASNETVEAIRELYRDVRITRNQKDAITDKIIAFAAAGVAFDALVKRYEDVYKTSENIPKAEWQKALNLFNSEIVEKLVAVLVELKLMQTSAKLTDTINIIISLVKILAKGFKVEDSVSAKLAV